MIGVKNIVSLAGTIGAALMCLAIIGCMRAATVDGGVERTQPGFAAGPGEKTFREKYNVHLALPMEESAFLDALRRLNLRYELFASRGDKRMPDARWSYIEDLVDAERCYQIYGAMDVRTRSAEVYRAFVDSNGDVFYVENAFTYTAPL